jgi:signal transduction histidine kinase
MTARDAAILIAYSFGAALGTYVLARLLLPGARRRSVGLAAALVALVPVVSVVVGSLAAARAMFVSTHDLTALLVIVGGAGAAGVLGALALATELRAARAEADAAAARVARVDQSRRELVAWVSHDLRTPLASIRAMVEAITDGVVADPPTIRRYHEQMNDEIDRLAQLVDDLFELSRIEADALQLTLEQVSLGEIVSDAISTASVIAEGKGITIVTTAEHPLPDVRASTRELTRVVRNLLENAVRHTPTGGAVDVAVERVDGHVVVSVRDECGGIAESDLAHVFEVAYRGDDARTEVGSGLGLAIVRGFVDAHDGAIDVLNVDRGCCFTVRLPVIDD